MKLRLLWPVLAAGLFAFNSQSAQQTVNIGTSANDGTGDTLRTAFGKVNTNFTETFGWQTNGMPFKQKASAPTANSTNAWIYAATNASGVVKMYVLDSSGNVLELGAGSPGAPLGGLQFNQAGSLAGVTNGTLQAHTNLHSLGWPIYNVKNFGAIGDGSTDDTTSIQTTLNTAQSQTRPSVVYFPPGLYRLTSALLITNSYVNVQGHGRGSSVLRVTTSGIGRAIYVHNSAARLFNVNIGGLRIEGTNGLASPPNGIEFVNASGCEFFDIYGTKLNNGVVIDGCEIMYGRSFTMSENNLGVYQTRQNANGFSYANLWAQNFVLYHNTNAGFRIDSSVGKSVFRDGWIEGSTNGFHLLNRATTDTEIDQMLIEGVQFQNLGSAEGFDGGRFIAAIADGVTNSFIILNLTLDNVRANTYAASNSVEFIKGANTNTATQFFNVRVKDSMFANVTNSAIYSDVTMRVHPDNNWVQSGLPIVSGSVVQRWMAPSTISMLDTNRDEQTFVTRTSGNAIQLWTFPTNSGMDLIVFDTTKSFIVDVGNDGNNLQVSSSAVTVTGPFVATGNIDTSGQLQSGSENRNITTAAGRLDIAQFTTNGAAIGNVPTFTNNTVEWVAPPSGSGSGTVTSVQVTSSPDFVSAGGPITTSGTITLTPTNMARLNGTNTFTGTNTFDVIPIVPDNSFALGTKTTGNYAAGDAEAGAALSGDSATAFFSAGQIERARGGTGADTSAYGTGILGSDGSNNTIDIDTLAEFDTALGITGTPDATTFWRGDNTWATPSGSGDMVKASSNLVTGSVIFQGVQAQNTGTNIFVDANTNLVFFTLTNNAALIVTNRSNNTGTKKIIVRQDSVGGWTLAFNAADLFLNSTNTTMASPPNMPTNAGVAMIWETFMFDNTNYWAGPYTLDSKLLADISNLSANGLITKTGAGGIAARTITGDSEIVVANGDGVSGNPTLSIASTIARDSEVAAVISDTAFASSWNGVTTIAPSKNSVYDWGHTFDTDDDGKVDVLDIISTAGFGAFTAGGVPVQGRTLTEGAAIDITNGTGAAGDPTFAFDSTEVNNTTWGDGSQAANTNTYNVSTGTDPILILGNNLFDFRTGNVRVSALSPSLPVFTDSSTNFSSTGTIDASSANVTLKQIRSLKFVASSFRLVDNAGCTIPNTNDFTLNTFMVPQFSGTGASNANFMRFMCRVPKHIDTSVAMTASLSVELTAADTAAHSYHVGVVSVANSAQIDTAATTFIDMAITGDGSGAAEDIESVNDVTLTGWAATLTANQWMVVELRRNGADASTVASRFQELEIFYTESQ